MSGLWRVRVIDADGKVLSTGVQREEPREPRVQVDFLGDDKARYTETDVDD